MPHAQLTMNSLLLLLLLLVLVLLLFPHTAGPAIKAGEGLFPGPTTPVAGLYCCGDSRFPGIGLPAVAASGAICANTLVPVWDHMKLLEELAL